MAVELTLPAEVEEEVKGAFQKFIDAVKAALEKFVAALSTMVNNILGIMPLD